MHEIFSDLVGAYSNLSIVLASIGLLLATSSFISGLQFSRAASIVEGKIHRYNGIITMSLYIVLFVLSIFNNGFRIWPLLGWLSGLSLIFLKLAIVRKRKRRALKYVSWIGGTLVVVWIYLVYSHIPI